MTLNGILIAGFLSLACWAQANVNTQNSYGPGDSYGWINPEKPRGPGREERRDHPGYPSDRIVQKEAYIGRYVRHETLGLRRLADIDRQYKGFEVKSVRVFMRPARSSYSRLELLINQRVEDSIAVDNQYSVELYPRGSSEIGEDVNSLQLAVRGEVYIEKIVVELSKGYHDQPHPPGYPDYDREVLLPLRLPPYLPPQGHLDLTPYVDAYSYRGYRIAAIEIVAHAKFNVALINVLANNFHEGSISLANYTMTQRLVMQQHLVLGHNFQNLILMPRGDTNLIAVRLVLRR